MQQNQSKDSQAESKEGIKPREEELIKLGPPSTCTKGEHSFQVTGMEFGLQRAQCTKCSIGYFLPIGWSARKGHIYRRDELVI
jgi:hypothetical protein